MRLMVFEDHDEIRKVLGEYLENLGIETFTFSDPGMCPLHDMPTCPCPPGQVCADAIISDVKMHSLSGVQFVEDQIDKGCKIKNILLMSGKWDEKDLQYAEKMECKTLYKPFVLEDLEKWLNDCKRNISPDRILWDWESQ
jgi:CheY-like chemotaxis protein